MYSKNAEWLRYDITCFKCHNFWQDADPYPAVCPRCGKNPAPRSYKDFIFDELIRIKAEKVFELSEKPPDDKERKVFELREKSPD